jgi:hypothetical protein
MSTALAAQPQAPMSFPSGADFDAMRNAAAIISRSGLVPEAFRGKPEDIMVAILTARGLGLDPMVALQRGYVVKGKFDIEVSVKLGLVQSRVPDYDYEVIELNDERCVIEGGRAGKRRVRSEFTYAQAVAAGLTQGKYGPTATWQFYRQDMLLNRALGRNLKATCAAALYNMPVRLDEPDEESGAVVVEDGAGNAGAAPAAPVPVPTQPHVFPDGTSNPHAVPVEKAVPVDWRGPLLAAFATCYGIDVPGENAKVRSAFVKKHEEKLVLVANEFYKSRGEQPVTKWIAVGPMDYEHLTRWLEEKNAKRAGKGAAASGEPAPTEGGTQRAASPEPSVFDNWEPAAAEPSSAALVAPGAPEDGEVPVSTEIVTGWQALVAAGHENLTTILLAMRHATKNEREFVKVSEKSGNYSLIDGDLLKTCGFVDANGVVVAQWLPKLHAGFVWDGARYNGPSEAVWPMVVRAVYEEAQVLKVNTQ